MKHRVLVTACCLSIFVGGHALAAEDAVMRQIASLQSEWATANYQLAEADKQAAFEALLEKAQHLTAGYPLRAEPRVWEAIIRAGLAGSMGGLSALFKAMPQMEQGRTLLLEAEKMDPTVLNGSVYTTLGSFYYMVPGGLIGFGDDDKAREYLAKALQTAPDDMDANYFMGDFLLDQGDPAAAKPYLQKVLAMPDVEGRPVYSKGRRAEAAAKLSIANNQLK